MIKKIYLAFLKSFIWLIAIMIIAGVIEGLYMAFFCTPLNPLPKNAYMYILASAGVFILFTLALAQIVFFVKTANEINDNLKAIREIWENAAKRQ